MEFKKPAIENFDFPWRFSGRYETLGTYRKYIYDIYIYTYTKKLHVIHLFILDE